MTINRLTQKMSTGHSYAWQRKQAGYETEYPALTGSNGLLLNREAFSRIFPTYSSPPVSSIQEQNTKNIYFFIFVYSNCLLLFFIS